MTDVRVRLGVGMAAGVMLHLWCGIAAAAGTCKAEDFGATVDAAGAQLRAYNLEASPRLQARIKLLAAKKGWNEQEVEDSAIMYLQDDRITKLDETSNTLLAKIDTLGRLEPGAPVDCAKLDELKATGIELLAAMKAKSSYLIAKIDTEVGTKPGGSEATASAPATPPKIKETLPPEDVARAEPTRKPVPPVAAAPPPSKPAVPSKGWGATTDKPAGKPADGPPSAVPAPIPAAPPADVAMLPPPPSGVQRPTAPMTPPPVAVLEADDGYTIDEIRDATRGFFGTVSTSLAAVIEHAFKSTGRPTGYILGQEGGGAFLGGLRYGSGTLYVRTGGTQKIYWHGPSVGFDFGAAGARTMFLVYKMRDPNDLYRVFTGIDGSAFVVGGVGVTLLGGGGMLMAPIRSGIGMRVGANLGYVRFTPSATWNPF